MEHRLDAMEQAINLFAILDDNHAKQCKRQDGYEHVKCARHGVRSKYVDLESHMLSEAVLMKHDNLEAFGNAGILETLRSNTPLNVDLTNIICTECRCAWQVSLAYCYGTHLKSTCSTIGRPWMMRAAKR